MDTMKTWNALIIDVDYSPSDPGIRRCFCERTQYSKKDLTPGKLLSYEDPGGLFGSIVLKECDDDKVVLTYGGRDFVLREGSSWACLGKDGRNYTNFELNVSLQLEYLIVNTPKFFRQFGTREQLAALSENDIRHFESSDDPCAKFVLGRWHYLLMPREDSAVLAEKYIRDFRTWTTASGRTILIEISAVNGRFNFDIIQPFSNPVYVEAFLKELEDNGITYDLQDVMKLELPNIKLPWSE